MGLRRFPFTNFTAGEFSPMLEGRFDLAKFADSARLIQNFMVKPHGGLVKRPGTEWVIQQMDETKPAELFPFVFNAEQSYALIFEEGSAMVATYDNATLARGVIAADEGGPYSFSHPFLWDELKYVRYNQDRDIMYFSHPKHATQKLIRRGHNDWTIEEVEWEFDPTRKSNRDNYHFFTYSARAGDITLTSSKTYFTEADHVGKVLRINDGLVEITAVTDGVTATGKVVSDISQSAKRYTLGKEVFDGEWTQTSGTIDTNEANDLQGTVDFVADKDLTLPFDAEFRMYLRLAAGAKAEVKIVRREDATKGLSEKEMFNGSFSTVGEESLIQFETGETDDNDKGTVDELVEATYDVTLTVTAANGDAHVDFLYFKQIEPEEGKATTEWAEWAFSDDNGHPSVNYIYSERLFLGSTAADLNGFWMSQADGRYEDFDLYDTEDPLSAMFQRLNSKQQEEIRWARGRDDLWLGTRGGIWKVFSTKDGEAISPANIDAKLQNAVGVADIDAVDIDNRIVFVEEGGRRIHGIVYDLQQDAHITDDTTLYGEHLFEQNAVTAIEWHRAPLRTLWALREDGTFCGLTYLPKENVLAWHRHELADAKVHSITVLKRPDGQEDLWMVVERTIDGSKRFYVECMEQRTHTIEDAMYLDSAKVQTYETPTTEITDLDHLEGQVVSALYDGSVATNLTVANGTVNVPIASSRVVVGKPIVSTMRTQRIEVAQPDGSTIQGDKIKMTNITFRFVASGIAGLEIGNDSIDREDWELIPARNTEDPMGSPPGFFTGDKVLNSPTGWETDSSFIVEHPSPLPCNIVLLVADWEEEDSE